MSDIKRLDYVDIDYEYEMRIQNNRLGDPTSPKTIHYAIT